MEEFIKDFWRKRGAAERASRLIPPLDELMADETPEYQAEARALYAEGRGNKNYAEVTLYTSPRTSLASEPMPTSADSPIGENVADDGDGDDDDPSEAAFEAEALRIAEGVMDGSIPTYPWDDFPWDDDSGADGGSNG